VSPILGGVAVVVVVIIIVVLIAFRVNICIRTIVFMLERTLIAKKGPK
jgi:hypothetical protein